MSSPNPTDSNSFSDSKTLEAQPPLTTRQPSTINTQTPPNRYSLAAHTFSTSLTPNSISPNSIFASFPEPTLSLSPVYNSRGLNEDEGRPKHPHSQSYPPPFPMSDENPASFFTTEFAEEPIEFFSSSNSKTASHSASNSSNSNPNSNSEDASIQRRRSYVKPVPNSDMTVTGEIIVAEGWRRHTRVFGGGVCKACEESSTEMERRRRLGLPVPMMTGGEVMQS
ncbi:hypothetical protein B0J14DRAFT_556666 [Halenospora varia]|nr:hypothetical protein B0J14DRAFT_556666 [Halenospora varia]